MPDDEHELSRLRRPSAMEEEEETATGPSTEDMRDRDSDDENVFADDVMTTHGFFDEDLDKRVRRKLDWILLPFLAVLFLLNSLDKSNIGNAETAGFTNDVGLAAGDLNLALAFFFAFFVALQPVGAALGRRFGMARWVPACMSLWGLCTILHIWVRTRWQLVLLRVCIASLEAGFYPTTVSYLSLWYTRYEFGQRLGVFYGQTAVAGVLGGVLSWAVFSRFETGPADPTPPPPATTAQVVRGWRSWEVLFLIEGCLTMFIALVGFFWLPHNASTTWFLSARERKWAEDRIRLDQTNSPDARVLHQKQLSSHHGEEVSGQIASFSAREEEEAHHLLGGSAPLRRHQTNASTMSVTDDAGLTRQDVLSAIFNYKIWHLLVCNILSAIPATAFGVFLPLVIKKLSPSLNLSPAQSNLLSAPPFFFGAMVLFAFTRWSDRSEQRLAPILSGLGVLLIGILITVLTPVGRYVLRYVSLCILLSGSFVASPLTVAWLANNTPEPGKRAILLGINGWGNLAGVFSAMLFTPEEGRTGYVSSFVWTLGCVIVAFAGFIAFWILIIRENAWRESVVSGWTDEHAEREQLLGDVDVPDTTPQAIKKMLGLAGLARRLGGDNIRRGDEKMTFRYGL